MWIQVSLSEGILPVKVATILFVWFHVSFSEVCRVVKLPHFFGCGVNLVSEGILQAKGCRHLIGIESSLFEAVFPGKGCQILFVWAQSSLSLKVFSQERVVTLSFWISSSSTQQDQYCGCGAAGTTYRAVG